MPDGKSGEKAGSEERISIKAEWLDEVMKEYRGPQDFDEIFKLFKKAVVERALGAELTQHLGYDKGQDKPEHQSNHRNGVSGKRILTDQGSLEIEVPRDRNSLEYSGWKGRKAVVAELKTIYRAETAEKALAALEAFSQGPWGKKYPPTMSYNWTPRSSRR